MGCSSDSNSDTSKISNKYFALYKSIRRVIRYFEFTHKFSSEYFLISTKSISKFIKLMEKSKVLENLEIEDNDESKQIIKSNESMLKKELNRYDPKKEIPIIYSDYQECNLMIGQNNEDNSFIIVDEEFFNIMENNIDENNKNNNINEKKVILNVDKLYSVMEIKFPSSNQTINFDKIKPGFYKFVKEED